MLSVVIAIYNTFKQFSRHNTEDLCICARRAMLSALVFTNGRQMAYALGYYIGLGERLSCPMQRVWAEPGGMLTRPAGHEAEARKSEAEDEAKTQFFFEAEARHVRDQLTAVCISSVHKHENKDIVLTS